MNRPASSMKNKFPTLLIINIKQLRNSLEFSNFEYILTRKQIRIWKS